MTKSLFLTVTALASAVALPAHAQTATPPAATGTDTTKPQDAAAPPANDSAEIIVTAQGRQQIAQDIPVAVSVISPSIIKNAGIDDVRGLKQINPSFTATTGQSAATGVVLSIRGVGTAGDNPGFEPAVGVFIDGVFRARAGLALAELPQLDRIEVLRGPQGTLFGRNTSAGALNIITAGPQYKLGGYAEATYGNYNNIDLKGGINIPLSESIAFRVDGGYHKRDGIATDVNTGRQFDNLNRWFARGQLAYENDKLRVRLIADYNKTDEQCCIAVNLSPGLTGPAVIGLAQAAGVTGIIVPSNPDARQIAISPNRDYAERVNDYGFSGQIDYNLGAAKLTSITAYRDFFAYRNQDIDFSGLDRAYRQGYTTGLTDFTQELRLQGTTLGGKLDWLVGGFYLNEVLTLHDSVQFGTQANQYLDLLFSANTAGANPALPNGFQITGSLGPTIPTFNQVLAAQYAAGAQQAAAGAAQAAAAGNLVLAQQLQAQAQAAGAAAQAFIANPAPPVAAGDGQQQDNYRVHTQAFAAFTHNIINVTDKLSLTLGLRYNHESKDLTASINAVDPTCSYLINPANAAYRNALVGALGQRGAPLLLLICNPTVNPEFNGPLANSKSEDEVTGTAKIAYKFTPHVLGYASYSRGYKSGGYNLDAGSFATSLLGGAGATVSALAFGPETVDSYEVGIKTNFSRAFQFNATGFYQQFYGYQDLEFISTNFQVVQFQKLVSQGVELESIVQPVRDLTFNLAYSYIQAVVQDNSALAATLNANGNQVGNQPRSVVTTAVTFTPSLGGDVTGLFHIDSRFQSGSTPINGPAAAIVKNPAYILINARVGLEFAGGKYGIEGYVENLTNQYYNITAFPVPEQSGAYAGYPSTPRLYGIRLRARF